MKKYNSFSYQVQLKSSAKKGNSIIHDRIYLEEEPQNVNDLIIGTVKYCLAQFKERAKGQSTLTEEAISDKASSGKITFDFLYGNTKITENEAIRTALDAFEDGLIALFIDNVRIETLEETISLSDESILTFVKLTMLAGRIW